MDSHVTPRLTRRKLLVDKQELSLTNDESELYIKINDEIRKIEQQIKNNVVIEISSLKSAISKTFDQASARNDDFLKLRENYDIIKTQLREANEESLHIRETLEKSKKLNESILTDHEDILNEKSNIIMEKVKIIQLKEQEIANLERKLEEVKSKSDFLESPDIGNTTIYQDVFKTPNNKNNKIKEIPRTPPSSSKISNNFENRLSSVEDNIKSILDKLQHITIPDKSISKSGKSNNTSNSISFPNQQPSSSQKLTSRIEHDNSKTNKKSPAKPKTNNVQEEIIQKCEIIFIGDNHLKNFKETVSKLVHHDESKFQDIIIPDGTISTLCSRKDLQPAPHIIFMAGSQDIQKTPIKDIKQSLDSLFTKYKTSTIHFVQIPFRYDDTNLNYHIERVNSTLGNFVLNYNNVILYETKSIIQNWDYSNQTTINQNGIWKICKELCKCISFENNKVQHNPKARVHWKPITTYVNRKPHLTTHPVHNPTRQFNNNAKNRHQRLYSYTPKPNHFYTSDCYDTNFPPIRQRNNFRY